MGADGVSVMVPFDPRGNHQPTWEGHEAILRRGSASSATETTIRALTALCFDDLLTGVWDEALRLAGTGVQLCESHGYQELRWPLWVVTAVIAAARGEDEEAQRLAADLEDWARRRGSAAVRLYSLYVQCLVAQGRDDFEQAFRCVSDLAAPSTFAANLPLALAASVDIVECAVRTDRADVARRYVAMLPGTDSAGLSPRARLLTGCAAAIADPGGIGRFEQVLALPGMTDLPYDRARVQLAYAERLRRTGSLKNARPHLTDALATFSHLEARPWHSRVSRELRGTGNLRIGPGATHTQELTPQERVVAELAASGLTNKQIATRIYLSHRTVGTHLQRVFQKLRIPSRAALRDALGPS
ncbi:helix-turn-helix transcriptional regulator [Paractinoplanes maris]|uniref:helix-turn-helix transcriptional regulator n=1 Tax=Paractinoplanes maris TaxID=1734446 RepID=UPI002020EFF3|nr:LuxR C-terminal-related transcriptional regulator [Actinoplanes maris]